MFSELMDNLTNTAVFTESVADWVGNISVNKVIIMVMMIFMIVGAIDKIRKFEERELFLLVNY